MKLFLRCIEYFHSYNQTKIALVAAYPRKELQMLRIAAWRSLMLNNGFDDSTLNSLCLEFNEK